MSLCKGGECAGYEPKGFTQMSIQAGDPSKNHPQELGGLAPF